ncbi:hypothetical protein OEZ86_000167 [Tetradesmus obliquus]|nr:hypothetical protein OEZ86_000167 [Tetradesmus obliquus]
MMKQATVLLMALIFSSSLTSQARAQLAGQANPTEGEVAFAAPPAPEGGADSAQPAACDSPCYVVGDRWPYRNCKAECDPAVCNRGYGVYQARDVCCSPGVAFPDGCSSRPSECWVVESFALRTCVRDDRKCLQGYGVFPNEAACCMTGAAFPNGCANVTKAEQPCWVVDTYWPSRTCRQSRTLCAKESGVQSFPSNEACCAPGGAFGAEGCSAFVPVVPCWLVAEPQYPNRRCRQSNDVALCNRGWGVFQSQEFVA